jgi:DNA-binding LytR/AlgR family response regulator
MRAQQEGRFHMQVQIEVSPEHTPPRAVIYTDQITPEIQRAMDVLQAKDAPVLAERDGRTFLLSGQDIYMVRVVGGETKVYTKKEEFRTRKRLYELLDQLGGGFMQISKSCAVNLSCAESVEAGFGGSLLLKLKNGLSDYVSRKYLPALKSYLGI